MPWSAPLTFAITLRDGREVETLRQSADLFLELPADVQRHDWNQYAAELLIKAAKSGRASDIEDATWQVQRALKREGMV